MTSNPYSNPFNVPLDVLPEVDAIALRILDMEEDIEAQTGLPLNMGLESMGGVIDMVTHIFAHLGLPVETALGGIAYAMTCDMHGEGLDMDPSEAGLIILASQRAYAIRYPEKAMAWEGGSHED